MIGWAWLLDGRGARIRTGGLVDPNDARYRAALHPELQKNDPWTGSGRCCQRGVDVSRCWGLRLGAAEGLELVVGFPQVFGRFDGTPEAGALETGDAAFLG